MYSSYTAASFARKHDLADKHGVNLEGALTWAFEFEDQPYFAGFRVARQQRHRPAGAQRLPHVRQDERPARSRSKATAPCRSTRSCKTGVRDEPDVAALASLDGNKLCVLVWHYHDDDVPGPAADVELDAQRPSRCATAKRELQHFRIDETTATPSPRGSAWARRNSRRRAIRATREGRPTRRDRVRRRSSGERRAATVRLTLPRQAVSLLVFEWDSPPGRRAASRRR